jgi:hypothetical protein
MDSLALTIRFETSLASLLPFKGEGSSVNIHRLSQTTTSRNKLSKSLRITRSNIHTKLNTRLHVFGGLSTQ